MRERITLVAAEDSAQPSEQFCPRLVGAPQRRPDIALAGGIDRVRTVLRLLRRGTGTPKVVYALSAQDGELPAELLGCEEFSFNRHYRGSWEPPAPPGVVQYTIYERWESVGRFRRQQWGSPHLTAFQNQVLELLDRRQQAFAVELRTDFDNAWGTFGFALRTPVGRAFRALRGHVGGGGGTELNRHGASR